MKETKITQEDLNRLIKICEGYEQSYVRGFKYHRLIDGQWYGSDNKANNRHSLEEFKLIFLEQQLGKLK